MGLKDWIRRVFLGAPDPSGARPPEGWTDDLSLELPDGVTVEQLVRHVLEGAVAGKANEIIQQELRETFGLSDADAGLAMDRVFGGAFRATMTTDPDNCPDQVKDPVAWTSYQIARLDPRLGTRLGFDK